MGGGGLTEEGSENQEEDVTLGKGGGGREDERRSVRGKMEHWGRVGGGGRQRTEVRIGRRM